ncbi:T-cell surface glycoprotein CD1a-like isoform X3 [Mustela nigripes]|uniref:T-cell surface glycoprotein CD1a-like isoform X3 n=1 Tax=Mustela nigripes TaxID=77151 RepID=UPI0028158AC1|nr:T-cell surface glycoprotein CD1a-like isoform X3 [Mustela nigripes]
MLFLQLVLLVVFLPDGDSEDAVQEPISFQITLTVSFYNRSWTQSLGSAWLDEIQTHGWDNKTGAFIFLWPWSKGNWSNVELIKLEKLLYAYFIGLRQVFQDHVRHWHLEYPFQIQLAEGCELHFGEASVGFVKFAYQGADLTSFQNTTWWPSPKGGSRAQEVCKRFNQYHVLNEEIHTFFSDTCPKFLLGLLDAGKADLQRQVRPEAWLSTGPSPGPGRLLLICHVSGFYPKPVLVMWMHGVLGCENQGGSRPVVPGEAQQSKRPGHGPLLGCLPTCQAVLSPPAPSVLPLCSPHLQLAAE